MHLRGGEIPCAEFGGYSPLALDFEKRGRGRPKPEVATFEEVREIRPAYNEIVVCTALGSRSGRQLWGSSACGLLAECRQRRRMSP